MKLRLWMLAMGNFVIGTGSLVIAGILTRVARDLNVSISTAGQLVTIYAITYAIAAPLLAVLTGQVPRRALLIAALALFTGANLLSVIAPSYEILFLTRLLAACGGAIYTPTASAVALSLAPPAERGRALALVFAGLPLANVFGIPFGTFIGTNFGWRVSFGVVGVLGIGASLAIILILKRLDAIPALVPAQWLVLLKQPQLVLALSVTFLQFTAQFVAFTYVAALLGQVTGLDGNAISLMLLILGVAGVIGNNLGGYAADRWNRVTILALCISGLVVVLFGLPILVTSWPGAAIGMFLWGFTGFIFNPVQQSRLVGFAPQTPGVALSLNSSMLYLGNAAGAVLGGLVVSGLSVEAIGPVGGLIGLVAIGALGLSAVRRDPFGSVPVVAKTAPLKEVSK